MEAALFDLALVVTGAVLAVMFSESVNEWVLGPVVASGQASHAQLGRWIGAGCRTLAGHG